MGAWLVPHALVPDIVSAFLNARFDNDEDTRRRVTKLNAMDRIEVTGGHGEEEEKSE